MFAYTLIAEGSEERGDRSCESTIQPEVTAFGGNSMGAGGGKSVHALAAKLVQHRCAEEEPAWRVHLEVTVAREDVYFMTFVLIS